MPVAYTVIEQFNSSDGESWEKYIQWAELFHLKEVISLDGALCPCIVGMSKIEKNLSLYRPEDFRGLFSNLDEIISCTNGKANSQILAVWHDPPVDCVQRFKDERFEFCGFDLLEDFTKTSALLNCGGFDEAFLPSDLSECGLIYEYRKAKHVQEKLAEEYPYEAHANCRLWAIWRMKV